MKIEKLTITKEMGNDEIIDCMCFKINRIIDALRPVLERIPVEDTNHENWCKYINSNGNSRCSCNDRCVHGSDCFECCFECHFPGETKCKICGQAKVNHPVTRCRGKCEEYVAEKVDNQFTIENCKVDNDKLEALAALEHEQWMEWSKYVAENEDISQVRLARWQKLWKPYADLTEEEKEQDRVWARKVLGVIKKYD